MSGTSITAKISMSLKNLITEGQNDVLTLCMLGYFPCFCYRLLTFFTFFFFQKIIQEHVSEYNKVWIQIRTNILIWFQTVCKGYQQMTSCC